MYCQNSAFVGYDKYGRYAGGYDTFNRVFGRDFQNRCGPCDPYSVSGLNRGYVRGASPYPAPPVGEALSPRSTASTHTRLEGSIIQEEPMPVQIGERTVKKLVQVPITREVKVPATIEKVVEGFEVKEFPVVKLRQEQAVRSVQEEYVDFEEREGTLMKEVWVKQEVPERFVEKVPVKRVRSVEVPYTSMREYTEIQRVEVPVSRVVEEPGYRVDQIVEYETREVEGRQRVEWIPRVVDEIVGERDLGVRDRQVVERRAGQVVYPEHGAPLLHHSAGSDPLSPVHNASGYGYTSPAPHGGPAAAYNGGYPAATPATASPGGGPYFAGSPANSVLNSAVLAGGADSFFGIVLKESVIGLVARAVVPGSAAAAAGVSPGDVLTAVDGLEVYSIDDWRRAVGRKTAATITYRSKRLGRVHKVLLHH
jgi:hypothetical protein